MEEILKNIRSRGWMVAVHNDYRDLNGRFMTFWGFSHPGLARWAKGEGSSDLIALSLAIIEMRSMGLYRD